MVAVHSPSWFSVTHFCTPPFLCAWRSPFLHSLLCVATLMMSFYWWHSHIECTLLAMPVKMASFPRLYREGCYIAHHLQLVLENLQVTPLICLFFFRLPRHIFMSSLFTATSFWLTKFARLWSVDVDGDGTSSEWSRVWSPVFVIGVCVSPTWTARFGVATLRPLLPLST